jgi:hypothetical protein
MGVPQAVSAPLSRAAVFLVVTINPGSDNRAGVRSFCAGLAALIRAVEFRDLEAGLSCVMGIGSAAWDRLFGDPRPAELHPFREIRGGPRDAVSTPGDLLFHIRAKRMDLCFEMAAQIMARLGDAVSAVDEVHGFRYFDDRDLLGFVDGTENPRGEAVIDAVIIGDEDARFAGGSYVIVQKYLHDLEPPPTLRSGEDLIAAVDRIRAEIAAAKQELTAMQRAPLPTGEMRERARAFVDELAAVGRPMLRTAAGSFAIDWHPGVHGGPLAPASVAILAAVNPDGLYSLIEAEINKVNGSGLSSRERLGRQQQIEDRILQLERSEELLIEQANENGHDIGRRSAASPLAVLGVKIVGAAQRLAAAS